MKTILQFFDNSPTPTNDTPTIDSLKSEELWQFIERPKGNKNAESRATDLAAIWESAQQATAIASRGTGKSAQEWALSSN